MTSGVTSAVRNWPIICRQHFADPLFASWRECLEQLDEATIDRCAEACAELTGLAKALGGQPVSKATFLPGFVQRVERVYAMAQRAGSLDAAMRMSLRLSEALRRLESDDPTVPVVRVVLLGGTGVGKSALFNA
jgi:hypothetical protein